METKMVVEDEISALAKMWNYIYGFSETLLLRCAIELDIANIIHNHGKPISLSDLAVKLPVQPVNSDSLHRLMRHFVHMKLFTEVMVDGETKYGLEPVAKFLVKGFDKCMADGILLFTDKDFLAPWHYIKDGITGDSKSTPFNKALGMDLWTYTEKHPGKSQLFNEALACDTRIVISTLVNECKDKFTGIKSLVDVGGGTGTAVMSIAKAFPHIKCTVYDLPHVIADSLVYPEINHVAGDMFKYIPNADAILLKNILHDWGDEECIQILKKCKEAVPKDGGKVIIIDIVLNVKSDHPFTTIRLTSDLDMLVNTGGKERTEEEWKKLFQAAGFRSYNIPETSTIPSVIEAFPY